MTKQTELEQVREQAIYWGEKYHKLSKKYNTIVSNDGVEEARVIGHELSMIGCAFDALTEKLERLETDGWRDIKSAPKTGERILLLCEGHPVANYGHWYKAQNRFVYDGYDFGNPKQQPTHWQPLPTTSKGEGNETN